MQIYAAAAVAIVWSLIQIKWNSCFVIQNDFLELLKNTSATRPTPYNFPKSTELILLTISCWLVASSSSAQTGVVCVNVERKWL